MRRIIGLFHRQHLQPSPPTVDMAHIEIDTLARQLAGAQSHRARAARPGNAQHAQVLVAAVVVRDDGDRRVGPVLWARHDTAVQKHSSLEIQRT
jgi:hypothetical protein